MLALTQDGQSNTMLDALWPTDNRQRSPTHKMTDKRIDLLQMIDVPSNFNASLKAERDAIVQNCTGFGFLRLFLEQEFVRMCRTGQTLDYQLMAHATM
jgi:hypothetical protein